MSAPGDHAVPRTKWSETNKNIYITIELSNIDDVKVDIQAKELKFNGTSNKIHYSLDLKLNGEIKPDESSYAIKGPSVEILLVKAEEGRWNRLTEDKNAYKQQLHVDWDKWVDEDEENEKPMPNDFGQGGGMGGMPGAGGMGGMDMASMMQGMGGGGAGGAGGMGGFDMSQFAGMGGGAGGMGGFDPSKFAGGDDNMDDAIDSDDEELPDLETTEDGTQVNAPKISEVDEKAPEEEQKA